MEYLNNQIQEQEKGETLTANSTYIDALIWRGNFEP